MKKRIIFMVIACVAGLFALLFALMYTPEPKGVTPGQAITIDQLNQRNGVDGNECWVAVEGTVYSISGFSEWQMGRHVPSNGKAVCGEDLTAVIGESPHGKSVLSRLRVVGTLQQ